MKRLARMLRKRSTDAERRLWGRLRNRQLNRLKFRRQVEIAPYIVDFACLEAKLIVEADGGQHADAVEKDTKRTAYLVQKGFRVLRFWNNDILRDTDAVLETIRNELIDTPHPGPLPEGEGEK